jgi:hypothetical protein
MVADLQKSQGKLQEQLAASQAEQSNLQARLQREAVKTAAVAAGVLDTSLLDHLPIQGTKIENGQVVGVADALKNLKEQFPKIFGAPPAATAVPQPAAAPAPVPVPVPPVGVAGAAPAGSSTNPPPKPNVLGMKPDEYKDQLERTRAELAKLG